MKVSRCFRILILALMGVLPLLLALTLPALQGAPSSGSQETATSETPQQVADTLDSIVQPRFQQNAGRFGMDRIFFDGHDNIYGLSAMTSAEKRGFRHINAAHRPYVIAFLHCTHRPGQDLGPGERLKKMPVSTVAEAPVKPSVETLATATSTDSGNDRLREWGDKNLDKVVVPSWPVLKQGIGVDRDFGNWQVVMRPVRASKSSCLSCHAGAKRGDTLGVMIYAVDKNPIRADIKSFQVGSE